MLDKYKAEISNKTNLSKNVFLFTKEYGKYFYFLVITLILLFDYFTYTQVFHLSQADFLNYFLPSITSQQSLIVFILFPLFITGLFILVYKIQYDFLKHQQSINYWKSDDQCIGIGKLIFYSFGSFGSDYLIYYCFYLLDKYIIETNPITVLLILSLLFAIVNFISFRFLISVRNTITWLRDKKSYILIGIFLFIKSFVIYVINKYWLTSDFIFFVILNLLFFVYLMMILIYYKFEEKNADKVDQEFSFVAYIIAIIFMCGGVYLFFKSIEDFYRNPYENFIFWNKKICENSLSTVNFSLLLNPLKISSLRDDLNTSLLFKDKNTSKYITDKKIDKNSSESISIHYAIDSFIRDSNASKEKVFYLPNGNRKLLFIVNDSNKSDINKIITVIHIKETNSSKIDLIDIGYIKSK